MFANRTPRPIPSNQKGFGLLIFIAIVGVIAFSIVLATSALFVKKSVLDAKAKQTAYLSDLKQDLTEYWHQNASILDKHDGGVISTQTLVQSASLRLKHNVEINVSNILTSPEGISYRKVAAWIPSDATYSNPPQVASFISSGTFIPCTDVSTTDDACTSLNYMVFDSLDVEKKLRADTMDRLQRVALKAQALFQARVYSDPDRDISINRFIPVRGCSDAERDPTELECLKVLTPLATVAFGSIIPSTTANVLSLTSDELVTAWGDPILAINDMGESSPPYTMVFRARTPYGTSIDLRAVQQL